MELGSLKSIGDTGAGGIEKFPFLTLSFCYGDGHDCHQAEVPLQQQEAFVPLLTAAQWYGEFGIVSTPKPSDMLLISYSISLALLEFVLV